MKDKWPTLEGRLNNPLTTDEEALIQLHHTSGVTLSDWAKKKLAKLIKKRKIYNGVRG